MEQNNSDVSKRKFPPVWFTRLGRWPPRPRANRYATLGKMMMSSNALFTARGVAYTFEKCTSISTPTLLIFCHANGFCKEVWRPIISLLGKQDSALRFDVLALDLTGHGETTRPYAGEFSWDNLSLDVLSCIAARLDEGNAYENIVGIGHSIGAMAVMRAEILKPGTFDGIMAIEPIVFPPPYKRNNESALVDATLKRRSLFESKDTAFARWRSKKAFQRWQPEALRAYAEGGLVETRDGFALRCAPEFEAEIYSGTSDTYDHLPLLTARTMVVGGTDSTHFRRLDELVVDADYYCEHLSARLPNAYPCQMLTGYTHFVPMECPEKVAALIVHYFLRNSGDRHSEATPASRL